MRTVALYEMLFGILNIAMGAVGYFSAGSWPSLVAGLLAGVVLIGGALGMQKGQRRALYVDLVVTLLLLGFFAARVFGAKAPFMPAGLMLIFGGISLILLLLILVQPAERKRIF